MPDYPTYKSLRDYLRAFTNFGGGPDYDPVGVLGLMLAAAENLRAHALGAELDDLAALLSDAQAAFLTRLAARATTPEPAAAERRAAKTESLFGRSALLGDLAHRLDPALKIGECPPRVAAALDRLGLPAWLTNFLQFNWVNHGAYVDYGYHFDALADLLDEAARPGMLEERLFQIGSASNGDPIVIRYDDDGGAVGMLSLEEIYGSARPIDHYHEFCPTLEEFLMRMVDRRYVPCDSWAARELATLRAEMRHAGRAGRPPAGGG